MISRKYGNKYLHVECNMKLLLNGHRDTFNGSQQKRCQHIQDFPSFTVRKSVFHLTE